ncbi:MAG TPA: hypothetical protein VFU47_02800 [Armatimonadota bacterium]|nr:hypothetical protein [Armatimonadota bacterium]
MPSPARAALRVHPSLHHADAFQRVYDRVPAKVRDCGDAVLAYRPPGLGRLKGAYWWDYGSGYKAVIGLREQGDQATFLHELGHHAWVYAGDVDQTAWLRLWKRLKGQMPSSYARENFAEGFAECFRVWVTRGRLHPELRTFLETSLGD